MTIKTRIKLNVLNIVSFLIVFVLISVSSIVIFRLNAMQTNITETTNQSWRSQSRRTLSYLKQNLSESIKTGEVNPYENDSLKAWSNTNLKGILNGGPTSDAFMIELGSEEFIWYSDPTCVSPNPLGRFMKDEALLHRSPEQAIKTLNQMKLSFDTEQGDNQFWYCADNDIELLEWVIVPYPRTSFNNESSTIDGVKNPKYRSVLIQLGTKQNEILKPYSKTFERFKEITTSVYIICTLVLLSVVIFMFYIIFNDRK